MVRRARHASAKARENAIEIAHELIRAGLVHWSNGYWIIERVGQPPALIPDPCATHTRKGLGASPVLDDWPRGSGLVQPPVVEEQPEVALVSRAPSSDEGEGNGWPR